MGDVIYMVDWRRGSACAAPLPSAREPVSFCFDLASADTYLAAERVDRMFTEVRWVPVLADAGWGGPPALDPAALEREQARAEARAAALRLPLVWPDRRPVACAAAMRIAAYASESGRAAAFVLAASRLAFCGGFDLEDADILAEASAAASLPLDAALHAAGDRTLDRAMASSGRRLRAQGAARLPVLTVAGRLFCGEDRLSDAAAAARADPAPCLAPPGAPTAV